ncbi:YcxB family protein [Streptomyces sp. NPDC002688]|uniref:YcxB family protein n=1 Tax=Streptomyces sp. NPDC002688 TaxID=3154423 RepID=UPI003330161D
MSTGPAARWSGDEGLTTTGGDLASTIDWQTFPWHVETGEILALTTLKTRIFFVVPKRGAQNPAAVEALRAVLTSLNRTEPSTGSTSVT